MALRYLAYDVDAEGDKRAERLRQLSPRMQRIRPPVGKDMTAFWQAGGLVRGWGTVRVGAAVRGAQSGMTTGPGYLDEGITAHIAEWGAELGDDDQERSPQRAHRLWSPSSARWRARPMNVSRQACRCHEAGG